MKVAIKEIRVVEASVSLSKGEADKLISIIKKVEGWDLTTSECEFRDEVIEELESAFGEE